MRAVLGAPFGHVGVEIEEDKITNVELSTAPEEDAVPAGFPNGIVVALEAYLDGRAPRPIAPTRAEGTEFQQDVWRALSEIPPGQTRTYGQLAAEIGRAGAARAVGQALRRNPVPLFQPCHRVTASDGLGGFGGAREEEATSEGPIAVKRWLLAHEARMVEARGDAEPRSVAAAP